MNLPIRFRRLDASVPIPEYKTVGAAGFDIAVNESATLAPRERRLFGTGLVIAVPKEHVLLIAPRSSNAKKGILLGNGIGIIDEDYCGPTDELKLALMNVGDTPYTIEKGERIAQGLFIPVVKGVFEETLGSEGTSRGGFGTTG